jgi:hypothetical protein
MTFYEFFHSITKDQFTCIIVFVVAVGWMLDNIVDTITKNLKK